MHTPYSQTTKDYLLDLIFPRQCIGCSLLMPLDTPGFLCQLCFKGIPINIEHRCPFCPTKTIRSEVCFVCHKRNSIDHVFVASSYKHKTVERLIHALKYEFVQQLAHDIRPLMTRYAQKYILPILPLQFITPLVVPVPLHHLRHNWRGFNQSEILAHNIATDFGWHYTTQALQRHYNIKQQAEIQDRESRIANVKQAFDCLRPDIVSQRLVILVDDVATTSSTLNECARVLKAAGARKVIGFVIARN